MVSRWWGAMTGKCKNCKQLTEVNLDKLCETCHEQMAEASGENDPSLWGDEDHF